MADSYMHRLTHTTSIILGGLVAALFAGILYAGGGGGKPYTVKKGHLVDSETYNGWRRFEGTCNRCHGPEGVGSTLAPALTTKNGRLQGMNFIVFKTVVTNGFKGQIGTMPAFGKDKNIAPYIDDIWSYLQAVKDGAITGKVEELGGGGPKKYSGWE
jgi:mono/diheme cytochrome c family protein